MHNRLNYHISSNPFVLQRVGTKCGDKRRAIVAPQVFSVVYLFSCIPLDFCEPFCLRRRVDTVVSPCHLAVVGMRNTHTIAQRLGHEGSRGAVRTPKHVSSVRRHLFQEPSQRTWLLIITAWYSADKDRTGCRGECRAWPFAREHCMGEMPHHFVCRIDCLKVTVQ